MNMNIIQIRIQLSLEIIFIRVAYHSNHSCERSTDEDEIKLLYRLKHFKTINFNSTKHWILLLKNFQHLQKGTKE